MRLVLPLLFIAILLAACGSPESTSTPTPVQWQRVIYEPAPAFALNIPGDWNYETTASGIIVFNRPGLLERQENYAELPAGAIVFSLTLLSADDAQMIGARDAVGILDAYVGASGGPAYASATLIEIRGRDTAQRLVGLGEGESLLLAMALGRSYALAILVAPKGELQRQRDLLNQIFDSLEMRAGR